MRKELTKTFDDFKLKITLLSPGFTQKCVSAVRVEPTLDPRLLYGHLSSLLYTLDAPGSPADCASDSTVLRTRDSKFGFLCAEARAIPLGNRERMKRKAKALA